MADTKLHKFLYLEINITSFLFIVTAIFHLDMMIHGVLQYWSILLINVFSENFCWNGILNHTKLNIKEYSTLVGYIFFYNCISTRSY